MPSNQLLQLDEIDRKLLRELQRNADRPLHELGDLVGLSPSAVSRRITRYKSQGTIERTVAIVSPETTPIAVHVLCHIACTNDSEQDLGALKAQVADLNEVVHCYEVTGIYDLIAVFAVPTMAKYTQITRDYLANNKSVERFESHVVLDVAKTTSEIPL